MKFFHFLSLFDLVTHCFIFFTLLICQLRIEFLLFKSQLILQSQDFSIFSVAKAFDPIFRVTFTLNQFFLCQIYLFK